MHSLAASGSAATGKTETLRIFEKTRSIQLTKADGRVLKRLPIAEPQPGDLLDAVFDIFAGATGRASPPRRSSRLRPPSSRTTTSTSWRA